MLEDLRKAFNINHKAYSSALNSLDGHMAVLRAVINDLNADAVTTVEGTGAVSWESYITAYNEYLVKCESPAEAPLVTTDTQLTEEVFGGDYGSGH